MISVLIVEDDVMVAQLNRDYLSSISGFSVVGCVHNSYDAMEFMANHTIALLLLDVFMPGVDGLALLKEIRQKYPNVDVIMVTAARNSSDIQTAIRLGALDYIVKPFTFERFNFALTNYRERINLLGENQLLSQETIDKRILTKIEHQRKMPKGIEAETLNRVRTLLKMQTKLVDVQDLVPLIKLSRISLKKYLDHLVETKELYSELAYRGQGRPVTLYRYIGKK